MVKLLVGSTLLVFVGLLHDHLTELGRKSAVDSVQNSHLVNFVHKSSLLCHLSEHARRQVQVNAINNFICNGVVGVCVDQSLSQLLTVGFGPAIVLYFDMEVLRALRAKELGAPLVRAHVGSIDLSGCSSQVLLSLVLGIRRCT